MKITILLLMMLSHEAFSHQIEFDIYEVSDDERTLIHTGTLDYEISDLRIFKKEANHQTSWKKD